MVHTLKLKSDTLTFVDLYHIMVMLCLRVVTFHAPNLNILPYILLCDWDVIRPPPTPSPVILTHLPTNPSILFQFSHCFIPIEICFLNNI